VCVLQETLWRESSREDAIATKKADCRVTTKEKPLMLQ
jgi:hypothetical protein